MYIQSTPCGKILRYQKITTISKKEKKRKKAKQRRNLISSTFVQEYIHCFRSLFPPILHSRSLRYYPAMCLLRTNGRGLRPDWDQKGSVRYRSVVLFCIMIYCLRSEFDGVTAHIAGPCVLYLNISVNILRSSQYITQREIYTEYVVYSVHAAIANQNYIDNNPKHLDTTY